MSSCATCIGCDAKKRLDAFNKVKTKNAALQDFTYNLEEDSYPLSMMLSLTDSCNLACPYCFVHQHQNHMTLETAQQSIEWLKANYKKRNNTDKMTVNFFGGEPLLRFNEVIVPLVEQYHEIVDFGITTNGVLLNEDVVDFFYKYNVNVLLSLDGCPEVQNSQRPGKSFNSFNEVLKNIPYLLLRFPYTVMRATVTKQSIPYIYENVLMAEELGFLKVVFCPNAFEEWDKDDESMLYEQFNKVGLHIYKKLLQPEDNLVIQVEPLIEKFNDVSALLTNSLKFNNLIHRCGLGTTTCAITPSGDIIPCQEKTSNPTTILGNVYDGINTDIHREFLENYFKLVNNISCDKGCSERNQIICMADICPSRLEDQSFKISSSSCAFTRMTTKVATRLHFLCADSFHPYIKNYFEGD